MKITIIGAGNVGGALASRWTSHEVTIAARNPESPKVKEALLLAPGTPVLDIASAVAAAEVILLATPPQAVLDVLEQVGSLKGKVVIDATNALRAKPDPYPTAFHALVEKSEAEVVKCFNSTGFENMHNPHYGDQAIDMFMAGDSAHAKQVAHDLALEAGFGTCIDFGGSDKVLLLEQFAFCWINLAIMQGLGRDLALCLVRRPA